jgi:hypothetical protein
MLMIGSLLLGIVSFFEKDSLPAADNLRAELNQEPRQIAVQRPLLQTRVKGVQYSIQPRYSYDLYGLVVSLHDSDSWWDYAHREWGDHVNVVDFCVVWGENIRRGAYRPLSFWNDQWTCWVKTDSDAAWKAFDPAALSNNHLVTDDPRVARELRKVRIGDQVHFRGYLVDYSVVRNGAAGTPRVSSTVRTDAGNGACEVVYVEDFEVLASPNKLWHRALHISLWTLLASLIAWALLPPKFND